ncbi:unnamed protein product [Diamesa serratosioi]
MKRKHSKQSESAKKVLKCQCCLKPIKSDDQAVDLTNKIARQFLKFTNLELTIKDGSKICVICKKALKYISNLRSVIVSKNKLINLDASSFNKISTSIASEQCRSCFNDQKLKSVPSKVSLQFEELTQIKLTESDKLCLLCQNELNYFTRVRKDLQEIHLKAEINQHHEESANISCYYCTKQFKDEEKMFGVTDKVANQFKDITGIDLLGLSSICRVCKLKLDYVEILQSNLQENQKLMDGYVDPCCSLKDIILVTPVEEKPKDKSIVKRRRVIDYKSTVEEAKVVKKTTEFNCIHCDKGFHHLPLLNVHINISHNDLNPVKCRKCDKWYKIKSVDANNISISEERMKKYKCDNCVRNQLKEDGIGYKRRNKDSPKKEKVPEIKSIKVQKCDICGFVVKATTTLVEHIAHMHCDDRPLPCLQCTSAFKTKSDLKKHVRRVHEMERNAKCPLCIKTFFGNDGVKLHIQQFHSDERNYKCEGYGECEKTFKNKYKLDQHIRYLHLLERNHPCVICGQGKVDEFMIN